MLEDLDVSLEAGQVTMSSFDREHGIRNVGQLMTLRQNDMLDFTLPMNSTLHVGIRGIGEIGLSDSLNELADEGDVFGYFIDGVWHDTGDQLKYIKAVVDLALESEEYGQELTEYLKDRLKN